MSAPVNVTGKARPPREVAAEAFGTLPDWIEALVIEVERTNGARTASRIGYSAGVVSQVLRRTYAGDIGKVEAAIRGALMGETVDCPVLGEIGRDRCLQEQDMPRAATSAVRTRLYTACRSGCPHSRIKGLDDAAQ